MYRQILSKLGNNVWFPEVPSNWVRRTTKLLAESSYPRDDYPFMAPLYAHDDVDDAVKFESGKLYKQHVQSLTPKYSHSIVSAASQVILEKGKPFDVVSWLSTNVDDNEKSVLIRNNGDVVHVESLMGKRILVCGLLIPFSWNSGFASHVRALPYACSLESYELVIVPKVLVDDNMNDDDYAEDAFNHFISGLPSSALIVPFSDTLRRDFLCKSLNLVEHPEYLCVLCVGDNQKVLCYHSIEFCAVTYSLGLSFDFEIAGRSWWKAHSKLDDIFDCKPSDFVYNVAGDNKISISQLNEKLVGIYLCVEGTFIRPLNLIYQECKARNLEVEIVVVFIPYFFSTGPQLFKDAMIGYFHQLNISTWWLLPFSNLVSYKLWRACFESWDDQLIIVGPHNKFVEPYGKQVLDFGVDAYPFNRELLLAKDLEAYRALTLESLLAYGSDDHLLLKTLLCESRQTPECCKYNFKKLPMSELQGKTVLLYADHLDSLNFGLYFPLLNWYCQLMKTIKPPHDFEVVFCNLDGGDLMMSSAIMMPWLLCTLDPAQAFVMKDTLLKGRHSIVAAFGKDGKIISLNAEHLLDSYGPYDFSSYGGLRNEVSEDISYSIYGDHAMTLPMDDIA